MLANLRNNKAILTASGIILGSLGLYYVLSKNNSKQNGVNSNNRELIQQVLQTNKAHKIVEQALLLVDRAHYCRSFDSTTVQPYVDAAQPLPCNATISAPHMHVTCLQAIHDVFLDPTVKHVNILDVGSGSGYISIVLAHMARLCNKPYTVHGIEHMQELVTFAQQSKTLDAKASSLQGIHFHVGDGFAGLTQQAPFDIIHVGAGAPQVPFALVEQLRATTGRMVIPVQIPESPFQMLMAISKTEQGKVNQQPICKVRFVPLGSKDRQLHSAYSNETRPKLLQDSETGERRVIMPFLMNVEEKIDLTHQKWTTAQDL